jgi:beta-fructofuranosidase
MTRFTGGDGAGPGRAPDEPQRPSLHFTAERGWINDPHGLSFRDGRYHLFYQSVPDASSWQPRCSWGHATSPDLLSWEQQPPALVPGDGDDGCWSGSVCTSPADGPTALFYTSVTMSDLDLAAIRIARPMDDDWTTWRKGPVVVPPPPHLSVRVFRDPNVFWDEDCWRMLVGAGYQDGRPAVLCYRSSDQEQWTYEGPLAQGAAPGPRARHTAWECPQLIRIADRDILMVSVVTDGATRNAAVAVGTYHRGRMRIDHWSDLTHGPGHYAPSTFLDADAQPCVIFWIRDVADAVAGWSGALSIPYRLSLVDDRLALTPHPAVTAARPDPNRTFGFTWHPDPGRSSQLSLRSDDGRPALDLLANDDHLMVATPTDNVTAPREGEDVDVLLDGGILEVITRHGVVGLPIPAVPAVVTEPTAITPWWR